MSVPSAVFKKGRFFRKNLPFLATALTHQKPDLPRTVQRESEDLKRISSWRAGQNLKWAYKKLGVQKSHPDKSAVAFSLSSDCLLRRLDISCCFKSESTASGLSLQFPVCADLTFPLNPSAQSTQLIYWCVLTGYAISIAETKSNGSPPMKILRISADNSNDRFKTCCGYLI